METSISKMLDVSGGGEGREVRISILGVREKRSHSLLLSLPNNERGHQTVISFKVTLQKSRVQTKGVLILFTFFDDDPLLFFHFLYDLQF